jgi:hypothetical protein
MLIVGTSYFVSLSHAVHYYYSQGYGESYGEASWIVKDKISKGEIHIGRPPMLESDTLITIDGGDRYALQSGE